MTLQEYGNTLINMGPKGQQAFMSLTQAVAQSEIPIRRTNKLLQSMGTSLMNTMKWQISSSVLHGFINSIRSAYGFAQDLNESLNNIRIVTGQNVDQMTRFAIEANKAAKALNTTTTQYTNAALIYYQQGLNDQQVKERTDVTIKMANVSRQSAEIVSDQMTAIWNNFDNGTKSLEYYADVITSLGAATASSSEEISQGLEKFASVAETVGLSYEYATAALATVTATTRQSADVVGTAFKTLFARLNDLKLGETLDDGTTLGQYTENLAKIGVNIKDASGQLKDMDVILEETAAKWQNLDRDQQTALAKGVAGIRQYNQFIALMSNWDFMQKNLQTISDSEGTLSDQADTYAEGWEAASKRVKAASQAIFAKLLDDDAFINILNSLEKIISTIDKMIDNVGGLQGVLTTLGGILTTVFSNKIAASITNMATGLQTMTASGRAAIQTKKSDFIKDASAILSSNMPEGSTETQERAGMVYEKQLKLQNQMIEKAHLMTEEEQQIVQLLMDQVKQRGDLVIKQAQEYQKAKELQQAAAGKLTVAAIHKADKSGTAYNAKQTTTELTDIKATISAASQLDGIFKNISNNAKVATSDIENIKKVFTDLTSMNRGKEIVSSADIKNVQRLSQALNNADIEGEDFQITLTALRQILNDIQSAKIDVAANNLGASREDVENYANAVRNTQKQTTALDNNTKNMNETIDQTKGAINKARGAQQGWADTLVNTASLVMSLSSAINSLVNMIDTLSNPDVSGLDKMVSVLTTLGTVIFTVVAATKLISGLRNKETGEKDKNAGATDRQTAAERRLNREKNREERATRKNIRKIQKDTKRKLKMSDDQYWNTLSSKDKDRFLEDSFQNKLKSGEIVKGKKSGQYSIKGQKQTFTKGAIKKQSIVTQGAKTGAKESLKQSASSAGGAASKGAAGGAGIGVGGALAIAGAIAIIAVATKLAWDQAHKAEEAVKKAKTAAKEASQHLEEAKQAYEEFTTASSNYSNAINSLKELTKGTSEYQAAVLQANEAASKLLETNENLKYTIEDGQIKITEESLEQAKKEEQETVKRAQITKIAAKNNVRMQEEELKKRDIAKKINKADGGKVLANAGGAAAAGMGAGALIGTVIPGIGNLVGAIAGGIIGLAAGAITGVATTMAMGTSEEEETEALEALERAQLEDSTFTQRLKDGDVTDSELKELGIDDSALRKSLLENKDEVSKLVDEMAKNTAAIDAQNDVIAATALEGNEAVENSKYKDQIIDISGDIYGHQYDAWMKKNKDSWGKDNINKASTEKDKDAIKVSDEFLKAQGLSGLTLDGVTGMDSARKFVYKDEEGNDVTYTLEEMQAAVASYNATQSLEEASERLAKKFDELAHSSDKADEAILSFLAYKDFTHANSSEFSTLYNNVANAQGQMGGTISQKDVDAYIDDEFGDGADDHISEETALIYGYQNHEEMSKIWYARMVAAKKEWDSIEMPEGLKGIKETQLDTAKKIESVYKKIKLGPTGEAAGEQFTDGINKMLEGLNTEETQEALSKLMDVDWTSYDALKDAQAILRNLGKEIDTTSESWKGFADSMRIATNAMPDFSQVLTDLREIYSITKDMNFGSTIKDEDYDKLVKYEEKWKDFFVMQADGTRKFIGNEKDKAEMMDDLFAANQEKLITNKEYVDAMSSADTKNEFNKTVKEEIFYDDSMAEKQAGGDGLDGLFDYSNESFQNAATDLGYTFADGKITKDGEEFSIKDISQLIIDRQKASHFEWLLGDDKSGELQNFLTANNYDATTVEEILNEAEAGNVDRFNEMLEVVQKLFGQDYSQLAQDYDESYASTASSLAELDIMASSKANTTEDKNTGFTEKTKQKALQNLGSAYAECTSAVEEYKEALASGDPEKIAEKEKALRQAIKTSEWREATKDIGGYYDEIQELAKTNDVEEIAKKQQLIASSFNKIFGTEITSTFVQNNMALINEWATATGNRAKELALELQLAAMMAEADWNEVFTNNEIPIELDYDKDGETEKFATKFDLFKKIIEDNPITINAEGQADMSALIAALNDAEFEAEEVARLLTYIGQTDVQVSGSDIDGDNLNLLDEKDLDLFKDYYDTKDYDYTGYMPDKEAYELKLDEKTDPKNK